MCSPSRSQSVHIMRCVAFFASAVRLLAIAVWFTSCTPRLSSMPSRIEPRRTHRVGLTIDGCVEQNEWVAARPTLVLLPKVAHREMPCYGRDSEVDVTRVRWHAIAEVIVLDPRDPSSLALQQQSVGALETRRGGRLTVLNSPPDRICVMDLLIDGFSATHRYLTICARRSAPANQHRPTSVYRASTLSRRVQRRVSAGPQAQVEAVRGVASPEARRGGWGSTRGARRRVQLLSLSRTRLLSFGLGALEVWGDNHGAVETTVIRGDGLQRDDPTVSRTLREATLVQGAREGQMHRLHGSSTIQQVSHVVEMALA